MKVYSTRIKKIEEELKNRTKQDVIIRTIEEFVKLLDNEELEAIAYTPDGELTDEALRGIIENHDIAPKLKCELLRLCKGEDEECKN